MYRRHGLARPPVHPDAERALRDLPLGRRGGGGRPGRDRPRRRRRLRRGGARPALRRIRARRDRVLRAGGSRLGDDPFAIEAILGRVAAPGRQMAARCAIDSALCTTWSASSAASRCGGSSGSTRHDPAHLVHDQHRHGRGDGRPRPAGRRLPRPEDQGGRPGRPGAGAGRPRRGAGRADPRRRQRGVDGRVHPRHLPGAGRAQRRADRAAAAVLRRRGVRGAAPDAAADPDRARRELPHAARRRGGVGARRRRQHQADQVGRHPRGAADDPRRPGAGPADHARLHERVQPGHRPGGPDLAAGRHRRSRRAPAERQRRLPGARLRARLRAAQRRARPRRRAAGGWP